MKKKILAVCLLVAIAAVAVIGATLAYFTDADTETNTFTIGNVSIDLIESQYHRTNAGKGNATGMVEPIIGGYLWAADVDLQGNVDNTDAEHGTTGNHTYFSDAQIIEDAEHYKDEGGYFETHSTLMVPGANVRKNPYVRNTGANDAYVRVRALVPVSLFEVIDNGLSMWTTTAMNEGMVVSEAVDYYLTDEGYAAFMDGTATDYIVERDGIQYYEFDFTYTYVLKAGEMTFWNCWGNIALDRYATEEDLAQVESFDVIFEADAIQAQGFATYADAFAAFDEGTGIAQ